MAHRAAVRGNAITEVIVALLALAPFLAGIPLLGKQLDVKHKTYDATRYSVWERTVWRSDGASNRKADADITLEVRDRTLGDPRAGMSTLDTLRAQGVTENPLWRDRERHRLLDYYAADSAPVAISISSSERETPVEVGYWLAPGIESGDGPLRQVARLLQVDDLGLNPRAFANTTVTVGLRPVLASMADRRASLGERPAASQVRPQVVQRAGGAILSDTWSASSENNMRSRVDDVTTNELIETLELPGRAIGMQALGRGKPLYGEGQYGWDPDLKPSSAALPPAYVTRK
jgi:hypothetical protein